MNIKISAVTDVGIERTNNEDAVLICPDLERQNWGEIESTSYYALGKYGAMLVVADGMGGANAGEIASSIAIDTVKNYFSPKKLSENIISEKTAYSLLLDAIKLSNKAIMEHVETDSDSIGLGTTIIITWIINDKAYIAWCGDSRGYCYNQTYGLQRLTKDHSYVQELVDKGEITPKQAFNHPDSNIITKCLGDIDTVTEPDIITYQLKDGDLLLSCSDGLCGYCDDKSIEKIFLNNFDNLSLCKDNLLKLAMNAGGQDNITIALCATLPEGQQLPIVASSTKIKRFLKNFSKGAFSR